MTQKQPQSPVLDADAMTPGERRAALSLAAIFATRMLGLFMILPVFALYADKLTGVTPTLVGVALGAYGLSQAMLQIPFGMLSDRFGRKRIITIGLLLFALGSVIAALADSIWLVILGRAVQGSGAIAAAVMALTADLTREEHRTKAMAIIGMSIGAAFAASLALGPLLNEYVGVTGIFWVTAGLALAAIGILWWRVPNPVISRMHRDTGLVSSDAGRILSNPELLRLDVGILILHMILTATFVVLPLVLRDQVGLDSAYHSWVYLPVLGGSVLLMVPFIIIAERKRRMKPVFVGAIAVLMLAQFAMLYSQASLVLLMICLTLYFAAFNLLEASLPSLVAKTAPAARKGTALGVYSSSQFFGAFAGGALGGWAHHAFGVSGVFVLCAGMALLWLLIAAGMRPPLYLRSLVVSVKVDNSVQASLLSARLSEINGVVEAVVIAEEGTAYLKVDGQQLDQEALDACLAA